MNVLLINPLCRLPYMLPLGLGYVASFLRQNRPDTKVRILDINAFGYPEAKVRDILMNTDFDIVGIGGLTSTYRYVKWLAKIIKEIKPDIPVVAGNMVSTACPELLLESSNIDIAVIDEGEKTFTELASAIENKRPLSMVEGIFYKNNGDIIKNSPRKRISDIDSLPFPAWDLFPMDIYLKKSTNSSVSFGLRTVNISTVRGCPYDCIFCSHPFGREVYARSPESIISEIKELKERYQVKFIHFSDDLSLFNEKRVLNLCEKLILEDLDIRWSVAARVNLVNGNLLKKMSRAGCVEVGYGFESGSQYLLDKMSKRVRVKQAEEAIKMTRNVGIAVRGSFIFGMPGETKETIAETLGFIKRTKLPIYRFFYATPYPGTQLYKIAKKMNRLPSDEDKYMESLGEMRSTFLVNLTDFSDEDLVKLKNLAEITAKKSLGFKLIFDEFIENWQRRYFVILQQIRQEGFVYAIKAIILKLLRKVTKK